MPPSTKAPIRTNANGRAAAANSTPTVLSDEDFAKLEAIRAILASGIDTDNGKTMVGNMREKFRETFNSKDPANWDFTEDAADLVFIDGNAASESYAVFSKSALVADKVSSWLSKKTFKVPYKFLLGLSLSQRVGGEEHTVEMVGVDGTGAVINNVAPSSVAISGTITIASNVATVNFAVPHNIFQGAQVVLAGNAYTPLNVGPVIATVVTPTQITVPCTAANGTYTAGGTVSYKCPCGFAEYHASIRWQGVTAGNADVVSSNGGTPRVVAWNPGNSQDAAVLPNEGGLDYSSKNFTRAFRSKGTWHMEHQTDVLAWEAYDTDATGALRSQNTRDNAIPVGIDFKARIRSTSFANKSIPVAKITAISKSGTGLATVTTDVPHNLTVNSFIQIYGVRDQTNFANLTTATIVPTILSANQFQITFGASATASSYGGYVMLVHGNSAPTQSAVVVQTYAKTADGLRLSLVGNTNWAQTIGTTVTPYGLVDSGGTPISTVTGRWRVAFQSTTTLELEPLESQDVSALPASPTNAGGGLILNTDFRLNRFAVLDRFAVKTESSTAAAVSSRALPVKVTDGSLSITGNPAVAGTAAQGSAASGNPVFSGGVAKTAQPTARADGQMVAPLYDKLGRAVVHMGHIRDLVDLNAPVTLSTTTETTIVAAIAAVFNDVVEVNVDNTSASDVRVDFRTVAAGAVVRSIFVKAGQRETIALTVPWKQATVNTAWTAQLSAAVTDVRVSLGTIRNV